MIFLFLLACWMAGAVAVLSEFMKKDMTRIRNKSAFVNGIIDRVHKELAHEKVCVRVLSACRDSLLKKTPQIDPQRKRFFRAP
jgi:Na+-transporting methylmalonyl-CoA/oxaloacetate decarboxylase gamma subunit